jgi:hypothetical protein
MNFPEVFMQVLLMVVHAYGVLNYVSQRRGMAVQILNPTGCGRMVVSLGLMHHHRRQELLQLVHLRGWYLLHPGLLMIDGSNKQYSNLPIVVIIRGAYIHG